MHRKNGDEIVSACCQIGVSSFSFHLSLLTGMKTVTLVSEDFKVKELRRLEKVDMRIL